MGYRLNIVPLIHCRCYTYAMAYSTKKQGERDRKIHNINAERWRRQHPTVMTTDLLCSGLFPIFLAATLTAWSRYWKHFMSVSRQSGAFSAVGPFLSKKSIYHRQTNGVFFAAMKSCNIHRLRNCWPCLMRTNLAGLSNCGKLLKRLPVWITKYTLRETIT